MKQIIHALEEKMTTTTDHDALVEIAAKAISKGSGGRHVIEDDINRAEFVVSCIEPAILERIRKAQVEVLEELLSVLKGRDDTVFQQLALAGDIIMWRAKKLAALTAPAQTGDAPHDTEVVR